MSAGPNSDAHCRRHLRTFAAKAVVASARSSRHQVGRGPAHRLQVTTVVEAEQGAG